MKSMRYFIRTVGSLKNMITEMNRKNIDIKRITKTASLLMMSGISPNSVPHSVVDRCLKEQDSDGGWVGIVDTMWNVFFLKKVDENQYQENIVIGLQYLQTQKNKYGLWGRSARDISRIPVTGTMFYLLPELTDGTVLLMLEDLWLSEKNSLTYKAAYTLMAFNKNTYMCRDEKLIPETISWLAENQKENGGFSPWKDHPVDADVFCTSIAVLGLLQYKELVAKDIFIKAFNWLQHNQLSNGIWKYHEIEDGASWGLFAMAELLRNGVAGNG